MVTISNWSDVPRGNDLSNVLKSKSLSLPSAPDRIVTQQQDFLDNPLTAG